MDMMKKTQERRIQWVYIGLLFALVMILPVAAFAAPPAILYTDIISGPNTGGENNNGAYLSIFGKNFGISSGLGTTTKVYVGNGEVARYISLGTSLARSDIQKLSIQLGPNTTSGAIRVNVNGVDSNVTQSFTVRPGNFYFVSVNGSDSAGVVNNIGHPYHDPQYVHNLADFKAGDFIVVLPGTYDLNDGTYLMSSHRWVYPNKSGTANNPITFYGYPGATVKLQIDNPGDVLWSNYSIVSDWVVANFELALMVCDPSRHAGIFGVGRPATNCPGEVTFTRGRFVNIEGHGGCGSSVQGADGVTVGRAQDVKLLGISVHDHANGGGIITDHPIYLSAEQRNVELGWSSVYNIAYSRGLIQVHQDSFGGSCFDRKSLTDIYIHDNVVHDVNGQAMVIDGGTGDIFIYNNLIYKAPMTNISGGYDDVISLRGNGGMLNARLYNNTVYVNPYAANSGALLSFGNVAGGYAVTASLRNNIFVVTETQDNYYKYNNTTQTGSSITSDYNIWYGSNSGLPNWHGTNDKNANPIFVNPSVGNFGIQQGSPAIGAGTSDVSNVVKNDFAGTLRTIPYDIGALKYGPSIPVPAAPFLQAIQ